MEQAIETAAASVTAEQREGEAEASHALSYEESEGRARALINRTRDKVQASASEPVQERIATVLAMLEELRVPADRALLLDEAELVLRQLELAPPNLVLCDRLITHLRSRVGQGTWMKLARLAVSATPHVVVAGGALLAMAFTLFVTYAILPLLQRPDVLGMQLVTEAGFAGSLTSLMLRFNSWRGSGGRLPARDAFFEGLFRPFIGVFSAWMSYYLLDAGLLPLRPAQDVVVHHFYTAVAFATGFSERLASSFVERLAPQERLSR